MLSETSCFESVLRKKLTFKDESKSGYGTCGLDLQYVGQLWTVSTNLFLILCAREREKKWGLDQTENEECHRGAAV